LSEQNRFRTLEWLRRSMARRPSFQLVLNPRQVNLERCAPPQLAVHPNIAAALLDHSVDGGKPQPRPLARFLGGKEWLEDPGLRRRIHPGAAVGDRQHHIRTWLDRHM